MTREAKLGAGVASAFLAVVGTWAGIKFSRGEAPANPEANPPAAAAPAENAVAQQNPPPPEPNPTPETTAAAAPPVATVTPEPAPIVVQQPNPVITPPDTTAITPTPIVAAPVTAEPPPPTMPEMPSTLTTAPVVTPDTTANLTTQPDTSTPALPVPITQEVKPDAAAPPAPSIPVTTPPSEPPPAPVIETKKEPEPPPSPIIITKPAEPTPPETIKPPEPSVTVIPAGVGTAASLGAPGSSGSPAPATGVSAARPRSEPRVQSYLEEEYRWQPGDAFAAIAQKYYFAEKYGPALQEYNRDHPLAGSAMKQNPPNMAPGQAIWVPPVRILERDYANAISDLRPLNERGGTFVPTAKPMHSPNDTKHFKVRERGETMYEIARRTLGDSGQWFVVHRLNPTLSRDPKLPIPGGTVLQLPVEAKTEAADQP